MPPWAVVWGWQLLCQAGRSPDPAPAGQSRAGLLQIKPPNYRAASDPPAARCARCTRPRGPSPPHSCEVATYEPPLRYVRGRRGSSPSTAAQSSLGFFVGDREQVTGPEGSGSPGGRGRGETQESWSPCHPESLLPSKLPCPHLSRGFELPFPGCEPCNSENYLWNALKPPQALDGELVLVVHKQRVA